MTKVTRDGGIVPSYITEERRPGSEEHYSLHGLKRGFVQRVVYAKDPDNITGRLEYVVTIGGQDYPGVIDIAGPGGIYQNHTRVRKGAEYVSESGSVFDSPVLDTTYEEKKDGEIVFCMFIDGDGDAPVIIGGDEHPLISSINKDYKELEGLFDRFEYNGLEFLIDKEGNYTIKCIGLKEPITGIPNNPQAVGSILTVSKEGDFSFKGALGTEVKVTNAEDKIEAKTSLGDIISLSATDGLLADTKMKATVKAISDVSVESATGNISAKATAGNIDVEAVAGKVAVKGATEVSALDATGAGFKVATGKVAVGNSLGEIFALLEEVVTALSTCTAPGFGAPISIVAQMPAILVKIAAVKGSL